MASTSAEVFVARLRVTPYAEQFRKVFGANIFDRPNRAFAAALRALERFELDDSSFHPFTSKYDEYLDGKNELTTQERRGKALFDDPQRGNCAVCHPDQKGADGSHPLFTDYQFEALGVPRSMEIVANRTSTYFDQGVCGPLRGDLVTQPRYCGLFKTPTLRNVATRAAFFHNGRFHTLKEVLHFYNRRDTDPGLWYPSTDSGRAEKFDDLLPFYRANVDITDRPFTLREGASPTWTDSEIDDVTAFLRTLTDRDAKLVHR